MDLSLFQVLDRCQTAVVYPVTFSLLDRLRRGNLQLGMYSPSFAHFQKTQPIPQWSFWQQTNTFTWLFSHTQHQNKKYCQLNYEKASSTVYILFAKAAYYAWE